MDKRNYENFKQKLNKTKNLSFFEQVEYFKNTLDISLLSKLTIVFSVIGLLLSFMFFVSWFIDAICLYFSFFIINKSKIKRIGKISATISILGIILSIISGVIFFIVILPQGPMFKI